MVSLVIPEYRLEIDVLRTSEDILIDLRVGFAQLFDQCLDLCSLGGDVLSVAVSDGARTADE